MRVATVQLKSMSPYGQSKFIQEPKKDKESAADFEKRCWRHRMHVDENGEVFMPPTSLKNCLSEAAKYLSMQIPGKGKATYTKHFEAGILIVDPIKLGIKAEAVEGTWLHVPSDGRRGGTTRVLKCFPTLPAWKATATVYIADDTITRDVFEMHMKQAGMFIGLGFFRPRNNGFWGRFSVEKIAWKDEE